MTKKYLLAKDLQKSMFGVHSIFCWNLQLFGLVLKGVESCIESVM